MNNKIIYITRKIPDTGLKLLKDNNIRFDIGQFKRKPTKKEIVRDLKKKKYDGVISFLTDEIDKEIFDACPTAKIFSTFSVGYNNIDIDEAKKRNIIVTNTPGTSATAVAEHTVTMMLALSTRIVEADKFMRKGKFKGWDPNLFIGTEMKGKLIGLVGVGEIGTQVAHMLHFGFNSKIIYSDISANAELDKIEGTLRKSTEEVLQLADIVSLHVPLNKSTHHLINKESLSTMKKSAFLINTSRGAVVDEKALVYALNHKIIEGAALDVFEFEPKLSKGLIRLSNVIITPHIASARSSVRNKMSEVVVNNIISFLKTGNAINNVIK